MCITPDAKVFEAMTEQLDKLPSHDGGDTGFLNSFFSDWFSLPRT